MLLLLLFLQWCFFCVLVSLRWLCDRLEAADVLLFARTPSVRICSSCCCTQCQLPLLLLRAALKRCSCTLMPHLLQHAARQCYVSIQGSEMSH